MPKDRKESQSAVGSSPQWIELPDDVTANILQRLGAVEILESAQKVCTTWRRVCLDPSMWRVIHIKQRSCYDKRMPIMCRRAVDRSWGQLLDLTLQFCSDYDLPDYDLPEYDLLGYIIDRSKDLKRLTIEGGPELCSEALKRLPDLEELHLSLVPDVEAEDVINIGISCPNLKSFTLNKCFFWNPRMIFEEPQNNEWALAIAENMPNLCHLRLIDNLLGHKGLEAILDGCPKLESLYLSKCPKLDLRGALRKRCSEQIKHVKFPSYIGLLPM